MTPGGRQYRVKATLGRGAFGDVFLAETLGTGIARTVAIKVLHPEQAAVPGLVARLRDEARMLALLKHRAIVAVDDLVELEGAWSIVMEYVEGADLGEILDKGPIPAAPALAVGEEVAMALHAAWTTPGPDGNALRLVHRDVKPGNVRVTTHGDVKLLDFGVARADFGEREGATVDAAFGTVAYMAPERFAGEDTHASDVYALGVMLFEMLTGTKPGRSAGDADRTPPGTTCAAQWTWLKDASPALHDLVASMLARDPGGRPTARECARQLALIRQTIAGDALDEWAEAVVKPLVAAGVARRREDARSGSVLIERTATTMVPKTGSRVGIAVAGASAGFLVVGGTLLLLLVAAAGWLWLHPDDDPLAKKPAPTPVVVKAEPPTKAEAAPKPEAPPAQAEPAPADPGAAPTPADPPAGDGAAPAKASPPAPAAPSTATTPSTKTTAATTTTPAATSTSPAASTATARTTTKPSATSTPAAADASTGTGKGKVVLSGDATGAVLRGAGGTSGPGLLAPGTWTAEVTFASGQSIVVRDVQVLADHTTTIKCSSAFVSCRVSGP